MADENGFAPIKISNIIYLKENQSPIDVLTKFKACYSIQFLRRKPLAKKGKKGKKGKKR